VNAWARTATHGSTADSSALHSSSMQKLHDFSHKAHIKRHMTPGNRGRATTLPPLHTAPQQPHLARAALVGAAKQQHAALAAIQLHHTLARPALVARALGG